MLLTLLLIADERRKKLFPFYLHNHCSGFASIWGSEEKKRRFSRPPSAILFAIKFISLGFPQGRWKKNETVEEKNRTELLWTRETFGMLSLWILGLDWCFMTADCLCKLELCIFSMEQSRKWNLKHISPIHEIQQETCNFLYALC